MLNFSTFQKDVKAAIKSIRSRPLVSAISVGLIGITMFLMGLILSCVLNADHITNNIENQIRISAFFKNDAEKTNEYAIRDIMEAEPNVKKITFVDSTDAMEEMKSIFSQDNPDIADGLKMIVNPLPDSLVIEIKDVEQMGATVTKLSEFGDVERVSYSKDLVENILSLTAITKVISTFFLFVIVAAMIAIIINIAKMSIHSRQTEIEVMKYLGAYDSLIIRPLFAEGVILGIIGGALAAMVFRVVYSLFISKAMGAVPFLDLIPIFPYITYMSFILIVVSAVMGGLCVTMATKKYLYKE